jgi:hypothetical protein
MIGMSCWRMRMLRRGMTVGLRHRTLGTLPRDDRKIDHQESRQKAEETGYSHVLLSLMQGIVLRQPPARGYQHSLPKVIYLSLQDFHSSDG